MMKVVEAIDPTEEMIGAALREVVEHCIEWGRTHIGWHGGQDRMAERNITGGQVVTALRGTLTTDSCVAERHRLYLHIHHRRRQSADRRYAH